MGFMGFYGVLWDFMGFYGIVSDFMRFMELFVVANLFLEGKYRLLFLIIFGSMGHCYFIGT